MSNLVYDTLQTYLPGVKRRGNGGWSAFNAICCIHNGETRPDTRQRGGLKMTTENSCVYYCFNCKYSASWSPGYKLSKKMETLMEWANVPHDELKKLKFKVWQLWATSVSDTNFDVQAYTAPKLKFNKTELPAGALPFSHWLKPENFVPEFEPVAAYVMSRSEEIFNGYNYYWSPDKTMGMNKRVIIPFMWEDEIVGFTARDTSGSSGNRYFSSAPLNYIFNTESIEFDNEYIFVTEGPFDAIAISGVAMLGDHMTPDQAEWLNRTGKKIVVVPDREKMGGKLVDAALKYRWGVSFPVWGEAKDAAQAVEKYGKLYSMISVIDAIVVEPLSINVKRQLQLKAS